MEASVCREIIEQLLSIPNPTERDVNIAKTRVAAKYRLNRIPSNSEIICLLKPEEKTKLLGILKRKKVRTASGVTIIAAMTKPWPCPKEEPCAYCPGGPRFGVPQS
ncbi:tRNA uridine(34) 5-carboxymethylaminomethyl modification radical SAM/GNAT enzyme Elp3, partial [Candidatus Bathyarchaeota archaeon]